MLTGDSYKTWKDQYREMLGRPWAQNPTRFWKNTKDKWKGWGGLKWCEEGGFQEELNREGVQRDDPDNPNPRQYSDMIQNFVEFFPSND